MAPIPQSIAEFHRQHAAEARARYIASLTPESRSADWKEALKKTRTLVSAALRASNGLTNVSGALQQSGAHMLVFRNLLAPPTSQDQFLLMCPEWSKATEKKGRMARGRSDAVAIRVGALRDRRLTRWLDRGRQPSTLELRNLLAAIGPLIANQMVATVQRTRYAAEQEGAIIRLLQENGWIQLPRQDLRDRTAVPPKHFMHKVRFATSRRPQEVDIACGLRGTVVLAMECKVTNDETNSIKRVNDVLKKAVAWQSHWGSFVKTAAVLQGVIKAEDVFRLLDQGVEVFWSHDLPKLQEWLLANA